MELVATTATRPPELVDSVAEGAGPLRGGGT